MINLLKQKIFNSDFDKLALEIFNFQSKNNDVYSKYLNFINSDFQKINNPNDIPFMPVEFFKHNLVSSIKNIKTDLCFESSSTTGTDIAKHYIYDIDFYNLTCEKSFTHFFGEIKNYTFRFLLPSYLERSNSSLVYMANHFANISGKSGFYINNYSKLISDLEADIQNGNKVILLGVSFALMDFAEKFEIDLSNLIVMETGGMKGRRSEITRFELHDFLKIRFNVEKIYSEYGMTELFSQTYSMGNGIYNCPPWMKIVITELNDPFAKQIHEKSGRVNIIDLANIYSCCFISTSDIGKVFNDGSFEILGRVDYSDTRGCSLLFE